MTGYDKVRKGYKWEVLALLWVAYLLNQADRQVFNVVLPLIREDLGLSDVAAVSYTHLTLPTNSYV